MLEQYRRLNRITVDDLHRCLLTSGFVVSRLELMTETVHIPRAIAHYPPSLLGVPGVKLLAAPV
jgi:hypothetical protein